MQNPKVMAPSYNMLAEILLSGLHIPWAVVNVYYYKALDIQPKMFLGGGAISTKFIQ